MADPAQRPPPPPLRSLGELALAAADRHSGDAMRAPGRAAITYAEFGRAIREIAGGLASLGVGTGDKVGDPVRDRPGVDDGRLRRVLRRGDGRARLPHELARGVRVRALARGRRRSLLLEDAAQAAKIANGARARCPSSSTSSCSTGEAEGAITLADLRSRGAADGDAIARERIAAVAPEDTATIVYTSGTTGPPKGCVLSHANLLYTAGAYIDRLELRDKPPVIFQYLPLAHVLARMVSFVTHRDRRHAGVLGRRHEEARRGHRRGQADAHPDRPAAAGEDPHARGRHAPTAAGGAKAAIFTRALATGEKVAKAKREGRSVSPLDKARHAVGDKLALSQGPQRARPERPGADHRRGADRRRGDRVLLRLRRARARGLRDDRDVRGGDAEHVSTRCRSAASGARCPAPRSRSATTARS